MALRWPSGVPVTDVSLVLGDTVPVRIRVEHALDGGVGHLARRRGLHAGALQEAHDLRERLQAALAGPLRALAAARNR